jgi:NAD(P)H-hydrate repair Nnr-like enzyme with NAD(P)H-hydrate epimerase domain
VLAVDLPSGLDAGSGRLLGGPGVVAAHTLALLASSPACSPAPGATMPGRSGSTRSGSRSTTRRSARRLAGRSRSLDDAPRRHAQHKDSFGDVAVLGGAPGMTGAALLAARAAHAAGAGRVYLSLLDGSALAHDPCARS